MIAIPKHTDDNIGMNDTDIIKAILSSNYAEFLFAIEVDKKAVNHRHSISGVTAIMLAAAGQLGDYVAILCEHPEIIDFEAQNLKGEDLLTVAMRSKNPEILETILDAYDKVDRRDSHSNFDHLEP